MTTTERAEQIAQSHNPALRSWVESANDPATDFPIQNLPLCVFARMVDADTHANHPHEHYHLGIAIGDQLLDITMLAEAGQFDEDRTYPDLVEMLLEPTWAYFLDAPDMRLYLRLWCQKFLSADTHAGQPVRRLRQKALVPQAGTRFVMPFLPLNYTDFYASKHHASNVGAMFRPDNPLLPNYTHVPIAYHGRASSIVVSETPIRRPSGQTKADDAPTPIFAPCKMLDYELELGVVIGQGNPLGSPIPIANVEPHIAGMCILNDWSARDLQKWEYQPLGPFLAKNFASTLSPFLVTIEALEPYRIPGPERSASDPPSLPYLNTPQNWGMDITVEAWLESQQMREKKLSPVMLSRGNFKHMYWTIAQMIAHHTSNGCNLFPGDLLGSGTISGPEKNSRGCLLELTWDGNTAEGKPKSRVPVQLPTGETRTFLADGDEVIMRAYAERVGLRRIGFGECRGRIIP